MNAVAIVVPLVFVAVLFVVGAQYIITRKSNRNQTAKTHHALQSLIKKSGLSDANQAVLSHRANMNFKGSRYNRTKKFTPELAKKYANLTKQLDE